MITTHLFGVQRKSEIVFEKMSLVMRMQALAQRKKRGERGESEKADSLSPWGGNGKRVIPFSFRGKILGTSSRELWSWPSHPRVKCYFC